MTTPWDTNLTAVLADRRIVLDCRWLGHGGPGRVTELLLKEFMAAPPPGQWILWGDERRLAPLHIPGSRVHPWRGFPPAWRGQRDILRVPPGDVVVYLHQLRPLNPRRSVTLIHDTIPLRYGPRRSRLPKWLFLLLVARLSAAVLTDSDRSRRDLVRDLTVQPERIAVVRFPVDLVRGEAVSRLRQTLPQEERIFYVGRFAEHKNLERLCRAFQQSAFAARGGALLLVGGTPAEVTQFRRWLDTQQISGVTAEGHCSEAELDRLMATSRALIVPSYEEGFAVPAFEAAASGLPAAAGPVGAVEELPAEALVRFNPRDTASMQRAIDEVTTRPAGMPWSIRPPAFGLLVLAAVAEVLTGRRRAAGRGGRATSAVSRSRAHPPD